MMDIEASLSYCKGRMRHSDRKHGFSLLEVSIALVIIGLLIASVIVINRAIINAQTMQAFKKVVVPCVAAVTDGVRNGTKAKTPAIPDVKLDKENLGCKFTEISVTITNSNVQLRELMHKLLHNHQDRLVVKDTVIFYVPGYDYGNIQ